MSEYSLSAFCSSFISLVIAGATGRGGMGDRDRDRELRRRSRSCFRCKRSGEMERSRENDRSRYFRRKPGVVLSLEGDGRVRDEPGDCCVCIVMRILKDSTDWYFSVDF